MDFSGHYDAKSRETEDKVERIYVIEDDENIRNLLKIALEGFGYEAEAFETAEEGLERIQELPPDLAIFDWMLPGMDGISLLREARARGCTVPVVMLTARSETEDKVRGLESGADYYLTKPFDMQELTAVVKTLVRRRGEMIPENPSYGNITLNQADYTLRGPEKQISLGKKEYDIMRILMVNREQVVSKETLLLKVWGNDADAVENNVEVYISFLRKKLEFLKADICIVTSRKLGYRIVKK